MTEEIVILKVEKRGFATSGSTGIRTQIYGFLPDHCSSHSSFDQLTHSNSHPDWSPLG